MSTRVRGFSQKKSMYSTAPIDAYRERLARSKDESLNSKEEDLSNNFDTAVLVFASDWHIGVPDFDLESAKRTVEYVLNTPNAILFCLGDMMNTAILDSVSDNYEDLLYPQEQWRIFLDLLTQVGHAGKLTVIHEGNHERRIEKQTGVNVVEQASRAIESYDNRGVWQNRSEISAPFYAERKIILKNKDCPGKKFEFVVLTHHGDGISKINDVQKLQEQNNKSSLNVVGHLHKHNMMTRSIELVDEKGNSFHHNVMDIILPSNGNGSYGNIKMFGKKQQASSVALEVTSVRNPLFDPNSNARIKQPEFIPAFRSIPLNMTADTRKKNEQINLANRIIISKQKEIQQNMQQKLLESIELFKKYGLELTDEVAKELDEWFKKKRNNPQERKTKLQKVETMEKQ